MQLAQVKSQSSVQSKAKFLLKRLRRRDVVVFAHFLMDLLSVLSKLSLMLQQRCVCVFQVHQELLATLVNLKKLEQRYRC